MDNWIQRKEEESYLGQLEEMVVQRLRCHSSENLDRLGHARQLSCRKLNRLSVELNEELERLENLIAEEIAC